MARFLPILISLFVISYSLFVSPSFAQEITPSVTPVSQINPQASAWEDFLKNLVPAQFKKIPDELDRINRAGLPLEVGESKNTRVGKTQNITTQSNLSPLADKQNDNNDLIVKGAKEYTIASGRNTPPTVSNASTNIFLDVIAQIAKFISSIFQKGNDEAVHFTGTKYPAAVTAQEFAQDVQNISGIASENPNVLGVQAGKSAMERALPLVQCAELPKDIADNLCNKK